jgi:ligand-binding sensor domain-containing protein
MQTAIKFTLKKRRTFFIRYALLPLTILMVQISFAQLKIINNAKDPYRAVHWSLDEGLSQGQTEFMIKDVNGFLWIGTGNGLNRFDGRKFKIFFHDPGNPSTISGDTNSRAC